MLNQENKNKINIFVSFPSFFQDISLLGTGLLDSLIQRGHRLVIFVSNNAQKINLQAYFSRKDVDVVEFNWQYKYRIVDRAVSALLYLKYIRKMPPNFKKREKISGLNKKNILIKCLVIFAFFFPEKILLWVQCNILSNKEFDLLFLRYKPILTIFSLAGIAPPGRVLVRSAKKYKCKTISVDACWDLMEYLVWAPILDKLLVWNEGMKRESIQYHGYPPEKVKTIGILRCDFYRKRDFLSSKERFLKECSLSKEKKIITLALNSICPTELSLRIIKIIRNAQNIIYPFQIVVRLDPRMALENFREFFGDPLIRIEKSFSWNEIVNESSISHLVNLLAHTDILISLLSTLILESCYFDKPNISIAFDPVRYLYKRDFVQPLLLQNGIKIAYNENDLINYINAYLLNPNLDSEGRKKILEKLCFGGDGKASERALSEIEKLIIMENQ